MLSLALQEERALLLEALLEVAGEEVQRIARDADLDLLALGELGLDHAPLAPMDLHVRVGEHDHPARRLCAAEHAMKGRGAEAAVAEQLRDVEVLRIGEAADCAAEGMIKGMIGAGEMVEARRSAARLGAE